MPGTIAAGDTGAVATDHYHRYEQDVELMAALGLGAYRFSIAWPRVVPDGTGPANERGLDFYRRLAEALRRRGIAPVATLYHWDLPQALEDRGGWRRRETAQRFAEYAEVAFAALGGLVEAWITHNEPWVSAYLGHALGEHAPGGRDWASAVVAAHHMLLSHGLAARAFREGGHRGRIGITLNLAPAYPGGGGEPDEAAARRFDGVHNRWFLEPVLRRRYPEEVRADLERRFGAFPALREEDLAAIAEPIDFLGVNYYAPARVRHDAAAPLELARLPPRGRPTAMGWEVAPEALEALRRRLRDDYPVLPLVVTENGAAYDDVPDADGVVEDDERIVYLDGHLRAALGAIAAGVPLEGYFVWSLLDNFEWAFGYAKRFGIVRVEYDTLRRIPKASAWWYRDVIARNGLAPPRTPS
jgi:beta-glucosidase